MGVQFLGKKRYVTLEWPLRDGKHKDDDDLVEVWCFSDRDMIQHRTAKTTRCRGNLTGMLREIGD